MAAGAIVLSSAGLAYAQEESGGLEEVVVTAQKRSEDIQIVPGSVSVLGGESLERLHASSLQDYGAYIPGFAVSGGGTPGQTTITLRGIAPVGPGAVVGTYVNDTPLGGSSNYARTIEFALDLMPYDIDRVEVLRGPQGTLYGSGTMGGLLKYVLKDPDPSKFSFRAGVEGTTIKNADDLGWGMRGALNAPLSDTVALRVSAYDQKSPGYIDNAFTGEDGENEVSQYGGRAALLWQASEAATLQLNAMFQRVKADNNAWQSYTATTDYPPSSVDPFGDLTSSHPLQQPFDKEIDYYSATLNWDVGFADFISASSFSKADTVQQQDASLTFGSLYSLLTGGAIADGLNEFTLTLGLKKWTQEFRLASREGEGVEWLLGAFYTKEKSANKQESLAFDNDGVLIPAFAPYFAFAALPTKYREIAGFGNLTFKITDQFDIATGVRWAKNKQNFHQITGGAILPTEDSPGSSSEDVWTYSISPRYRINDDVMAYLRVASGYRPGGPNIILPNVPPQVDADKLVNYEAGIKTELLNRRAMMNVAVFYIDWKDIQQTQGFGGVSALSNAGDAKTRGLEFESHLLATEHLRLGLNFAYTKAELVSNPPSLDNVLHRQLARVPKWSGAVLADYDFMLGGYKARVGGGYRYVDDQLNAVATVASNLAVRLPSYTSLDLNADLEVNRATVRLYARNVTDKRAFVGGGPTVSGLNIPLQMDFVVLQPRTFGVSVDFDF